MNKPDLSILTEEQRNHLQRDYEKESLKRGEKIIKEDLEYLYIELNLSDSELMQIFGKSKAYIQSCRYYYNLHKTKEEIIKKRNATNLDRYGYISPFKNKEVRKKIKETLIECYGVENPMQCEKFKESFKQTSLKKYGTQHPFQNKSIQDKYKETCKRNNGCEWGLMSEDVRDKIKQTCLENYGVDNPAKSEKIRQKGKQTCIERYGVDNFSKSSLYKGSEITYKAYETKKKNNTINVSNAEKIVLEKLILKFKDVKTQYRCDEYPFNCDFYIISLDLYIELNFHWTHGKHPFNKNDKDDIKCLKEWENKAYFSSFYKTAIEVWTERDLLKRETAKKNNLNWLEFFNMKQFMEWYETI